MIGLIIDTYYIEFQLYDSGVKPSKLCKKRVKNYKFNKKLTNYENFKILNKTINNENYTEVYETLKYFIKKYGINEDDEESDDEEEENNFSYKNIKRKVVIVDDLPDSDFWTDESDDDDTNKIKESEYEKCQKNAKIMESKLNESLNEMRDYFDENEYLNGNYTKDAFNEYVKQSNFYKKEYEEDKNDEEEEPKPKTKSRKIYFEVSYYDKEKAKKLGATFDWSKKLWFAFENSQASIKLQKSFLTRP